MKLSEITSFLESVAPLNYQEDYDNSGLIIGNPDQEITSALISLDCTEVIVKEAIENGCNLIISHHPIVFKGLKRLTGETYIERVVILALKNDIAIYAIHTNLDHVIGGVNSKIAEKLGLINIRILRPKQKLLKKLITYVPKAQADEVRKALFESGAGNIGKYSECSFNSDGLGTYKASLDANPFAGEKGSLHTESELKVEVIFQAHSEKLIINRLKQAHPYEEVAYDIYTLDNLHSEVGSGVLAELEFPQDELEFLNMVKERLNTKVIRHTQLRNTAVKHVAICGGSGSFLLNDSIAAKADMFITADFKYHEFFDADGKLVIADVGHFESEQFTQELLYEIIKKNFPNFALRLTQNNTNPINYLI